MGEFFKPWRRKIGCVLLLYLGWLTMCWWYDLIISRQRGINIPDADMSTHDVYWKIVLPPTLLAAYLILWPVQQKPKPQTTQPTE